MSGRPVTTEDILDSTTDLRFERALDLVGSGRVVEVISSPSTVHARVRGTGGATYRVDIHVDERPALVAECTCPDASIDGQAGQSHLLCKHVNAVLLLSTATARPLTIPHGTLQPTWGKPHYPTG